MSKTTSDSALQDESAHWRMMMERSRDGIVILDAASRAVREVNPAFAEMLGYPCNELPGMHPWDWDLRFTREEIEAMPSERTEGDIFFETSMLRKDGAIRDVEVSSTLTEFRGERQFFCICRDITERKRAEDEIRRDKALLRCLIDSVGDLIFIKDVNGVYQACNKAAEEFIGMPESEQIGKTDFDFFGLEIAEAVRERDRLILASGKEGRVEEWVTYRDGRKGLLDTIKAPFCGPDGKQLGLVGIARDITEKKQAEADKEKLEAQNRQLQKSESLGRMAGAIAHYFNNQLGAVIGNLETAIFELPQDAGPVTRLTAAMQAVEKAAEMSGLMLTYLGQTFGKREPLDLSEVCRHVLDSIRAVMPEEVVLETGFSSPGPVISANANKIQQVLANLAANAWEAFSESRGVIHLNVKTVSPAEIPASHRFPIDWQPREDAYACLEVADAGCGIADEDIEKLFDPFFSSKFTGRGLGLPVVLGIVKAHGGAVTVESEPGRGSIFRVFLPVSNEEVPRQQDKTTQPLPMEGGGTVLLVEDETMVRNIAATMLKHLGFSVIEAKDGVDAVDVFRQRRDEISCVLCDLTMPRMNGWETLTAMRKLAPDIPMILASGYDEAQVMEGDHPELPQVFLSKPYKHKDLIDAINQAMLSKEK